LEDYLKNLPAAETGGDYHLIGVEVPGGESAVTIYSYPPNDLAGGRMAIENRRSFPLCFGRESAFEYEKPLEYFNRTRADETHPLG
jgi:hypothetical protein